MLGVELIDKLRSVLTADFEERGISEGAVQEALNVVLDHYRDAWGPDRADAEAAARLSRQIKALQGPLTGILVERLRRLDPDLPSGEARFIAAIDARVICSVSLQMLIAP